MEQYVRTIKKARLDRMIVYGEDSLRSAISKVVSYYHHERHHQGLGNQLMGSQDQTGSVDGAISCRACLGGLVRHYYRQRLCSHLLRSTSDQRLELIAHHPRPRIPFSPVGFVSPFRSARGCRRRERPFFTFSQDAPSLHFRKIPRHV